MMAATCKATTSSEMASLHLAKARETRFLEMIFPEQVNHYGTLFGGTALSLMGKAAFVAASRHARGTVVMAASDHVDFHIPVRIGELAELNARVVRVGQSSMSVEVEVIAESLLSGRRQLAMRGRFEMVAVDPDGRPTPIRAEKSPHSTQESES